MNLPRCRINLWLHGWIAISLLCLAAPCWSQTTEPAKAPADKSLTADQRQRNLESFEVVWRTIRDKHWDPKLGGLNWQAIHDELRPKIEKATTSTQCREILNQMIDRLGQSHFAIVPEEAYHEIEQDPGKSSAQEKASSKDPKKANKSATTTKDANGSANGRGVPGFEVRVVNGHALVVRVLDGFPAAELGVRTGWEVVKIDGKDLAPVIQKIRDTYKNSTTLDLHLSSAIMGHLRGKAGQKLTVVFHNGAGKDASLSIPLVQPAGVATRFGNLPLFYVHYESRKLPKNISYFSVNAFFDPPRVMKALEETVKANLNADGFIIDLRGNPGGIGAMATGFGNWFVSARNQKLGTLSTRNTTLRFVLNPRAETYAGPLAILVDGLSASTSEILAGGLQDLKRAKVFGSRTAGAALPSQFIRLPNGDGFQFAFANYISEGGKPLEGRGVQPDVEVPLLRPALLKGEDAVLNAAVDWIHAQKTKESQPR